MDANQITFGCEFEVVFPIATAPACGGYHNGIQIADLPVGWNAQRDGSITCGRGLTGVEVVSPILCGADGFRQIQQVCEWLELKGARVNKSTGFHVHVGVDRTDAKGLKRLVASVSNHEAGVYAATGTKSREHGRWCGSTRNSSAAAAVHAGNVPQSCNRYELLNLLPLLSGTRQAVEFRAFSGTTNATKALGFIRLCIGLVEKATTEKVGRRFARAYPKAMTNGEKAAARLMSYLGWDGSKAQKWGAIEADGVPTTEQGRREIVRLSKKYDRSAV